MGYNGFLLFRGVGEGEGGGGGLGRVGMVVVGGGGGASSVYSLYCLLVVVCARINPPCVNPAHSHNPHYCSTIARLLRHI